LATERDSVEPEPVRIVTPTEAVFVSDSAFDVAGALVTLAAATKVLSVASAACAAVIVTVEVTPTRDGDGVPAESDEIAAFEAAVAGATEERTPKPKAATATSATRLKVVFVDICFLSISRSEEFPPLGFG
jgi:hypothetical protein